MDRGKGNGSNVVNNDAMIVNRREFVSLASWSIVAGTSPWLASVLSANSRLRSQIRAIVFDGFVIFDPNTVFALAGELFPGKGSALSNEWRTRQFEYTWLRVASQHYADFWQVTQDALVFATKNLNLELTVVKREKLMNAYLKLKASPDVVPALGTLKKSGYRLALLSNLTPKILEGCIRSAELEGVFEETLSTDQAKTYKSKPRAYQLGTDVLKLRRDEILFVAFAGWDAAGAKAFGYPTFWVNRFKLPMEELGELPHGSGSNLSDLVEFLAQ